MTTRTRTPAEVEAGARMESQIAYIDSLAHEMTTRLPTGLTWSGVRRALDLALGDRWVILPRSAIAADAAAAPAVGVSDDRNPIDILFEFGGVYHRWIERAVTADDLNAAVRNALERIGATETLALLTEQPEPGTLFDYTAWGRHVRSARLDQEVQMKVMADLLGITSALYCSIELGEMIPSPKLQQMIEQRLGMEPDTGGGQE